MSNGGPPEAVEMMKSARKPVSPTSETLPTEESLRTWMETPEFAFLQAVVLETMQEYEHSLKGIDPEKVGLIGRAQGFCLCAQQVASADFKTLLTRAQNAHESFDGGQSLLFNLRLALYRESKQKQ